MKIKQLNKIKNDINSMQTSYELNKNIKFEKIDADISTNIDADILFNYKQKLYDMNKFFDLHCQQIFDYNQYRIEVLKTLYESGKINRKVLMKKLKQIRKSNGFFGEQCYVDRIEVLKRIYDLELKLTTIDKEDNDIID